MYHCKCHSAELPGLVCAQPAPVWSEAVCVENTAHVTIDDQNYLIGAIFINAARKGQNSPFVVPTGELPNFAMTGAIAVLRAIRPGPACSAARAGTIVQRVN